MKISSLESAAALSSAPSARTVAWMLRGVAWKGRSFASCLHQFLIEYLRLYVSREDMSNFDLNEPGVQCWCSYYWRKFSSKFLCEVGQQNLSRPRKSPAMAGNPARQGRFWSFSRFVEICMARRLPSFPSFPSFCRRRPSFPSFPSFPSCLPRPYFPV